MSTRIPNRLCCQRGFSLFELLLTTAVLSIILGAIYTMYAAAYSTYNKGVDKADIQQNARIALYQMTREIRMAGYESPDPVALPNPVCSSKTAACVLPTQQAARIGIVGDMDGDDTTEEVEYELQNCVNGICNLVRRERDWNSGASTWAAWSAYEVIASNVEGLTFTYLPALNPTRVRAQVDLRETAGVQTVTFTVVSDIQLRNL